MAVRKVSFLALLLVFGTFVLVSKVERADAKACTNKVENNVGKKACPLNCDPRIAYGICPVASGNKRINFDLICINCCSGKKGCSYFSADGKFICKGESEYVSDKMENNAGKPCPLYCDLRIAYGICPLASGNKRTNFDQICTNCCSGKKGCNYFSADGTFICEGESEYVSAKMENNVGKACPLNCDPRIAYGICPLASGNKRTNFDQICTNCCSGKKGCNYFSADGTFICEGESEYVSNMVENTLGKACTRECDVRIAYGICPLASGNERINFDQICTNCCAGKKGCKYFSADGTFICEGESEYVSNKEENDVAV